MRAGACVRCKVFPFVHSKVSEAAFRYYTRWFPHALRRLERKKQHQRVTCRRADRNIIQQVAVEGKKNIDICCLEGASVCSVQTESNQYMQTKVQWFRFSSGWTLTVRSEHFIGVLTCFLLLPVVFFDIWKVFCFFGVFLQYTTACQLYWHGHPGVTWLLHVEQGCSAWTLAGRCGRVLSSRTTKGNFQVGHYYDLSSSERFA